MRSRSTLRDALVPLALVALASAPWSAPAGGVVPARAPAGRAQEANGPSPEELEAAVTALERALEERTADALVGASSTAASVRHERVAALLVEVLGARVREGSTRDVRRAAIAALGDQPGEPALEALHRYYAKGEFAKDDDLQEDEEFATTLLRAIGAHAHPSSVPHLLEDVTATPGVEPLRARLLGLARIRTDASLEGVLELMKRSARGREGGVPHMQDFRLALHVLTGLDHGLEPTAWQRWWNEARRSFHVAAEVPPLQEALELRWRRYWGFGKGPERGEKREDRGGGE